MSNELPQPKQSEEVDLGQLFKLIGNAFQRFFNFIGNIFYQLFLAFVWLVFFVKKHILKLVIAGILGIVLGFVLEKTSDPVYKSYITVKQNYKTGENLYNSIAYYNDLVDEEDINTLKEVLSIGELEASSILDFDIESVVSENEKIRAYDNYIKTLDSAVASNIEYEDFVKNSEDYAYQYQQIIIKSKERNNFKRVFEKIIENVNTNEFFKNEQEKDLQELKNQESALISALVQSDSLQNTYKRVLEKALDDKSGTTQTSITIEGSNEVDKTKEYELFKSNLEIRDLLVQNKRNQADKKHVIEIVSSKQDSGVIDNSKSIFNQNLSFKLYYGIVFGLITFTLLLGVQLIKFLERFNKN